MAHTSKGQEDLRKIAQFSSALLLKEPAFENWIEIDDRIFRNQLAPHETLYKKCLSTVGNLNLRVLGNKLFDDSLTDGTAIHIACHHKHLNALNYLLERNVDFTMRNKSGNTALLQFVYDTIPKCSTYEDIKAIFKDEIVTTLLKAHIVYGRTHNPCSAVAFSHFHIACAADDTEIVQFFLDRSYLYANQEVSMQSSVFPGYTPLHLTARFGCFETAKLLVQNNSDLNAKDASGQTVLQILVEEHFKIVKAINEAEEGADLEILQVNRQQNEQLINFLIHDHRIEDSEDSGFTKIHAACTLSNPQLVEELLTGNKYFIAINMLSAMCPGFTELHFAAHFDIDVLKVSLQHGGNVEYEDASGTSTFGICFQKFTVEVIYEILCDIPRFDEITFSDNKTKLADYIYAKRSLTQFAAIFNSIPKDAHLPYDSHLWPSFSLSHLAVLFSDPNKTSSTADSVSLYNLKGTNVEIQDAYGRTPLHLAFYQRKLQTVEMLYRSNFGIQDKVDINGLSHLHIAVAMRDFDWVMTLLYHKPEVNRVYQGPTKLICGGSTPLHIAVVNGSTEIIELLVNYGADVNIADSYGLTPMQRFIQRPPKLTPEAIENIGALLPKAAQNFENVVCSQTGLSHLQFTVFTGNIQATAHLLSLGANPNTAYTCSMCPDGIKSGDCKLFCLSELTPLHIAAGKRNVLMIELLLRCGGDILHKRGDGMALSYDFFCYRKEFWGFYDVAVEIVDYFIKLVYNDEALQHRIRRDSGITPLHIACLRFEFEDIKQMLDTEHKSDINAQINDDFPVWGGATPLHILMMTPYVKSEKDEKFTEAVKLFLKAGSDVLLTNFEGLTPIHKYWSVQQLEYDGRLLRLLLKRQKDYSVNPANDEGVTHFHLACVASADKVVAKFLNNDIDVDLPVDYRGKQITYETPLHFLIKYRVLGSPNPQRHLKTLDVLLRFGADINSRDQFGSTAFIQVASGGRWREIFLLYLHNAGADVTCKNLDGQTALEMILNTHDVTANELEIFINQTSHDIFNTYDQLHRIGILATLIEAEEQARFLDRLMDFPYVFSVDSMSRTPIHNMVANYNTALDTVELINHIRRFVSMGYKIDARDSTGKTALHVASIFDNEKAVNALLTAGAYVNIKDVTGCTFFTKVFENQQYKYPNTVRMHHIERFKQVISEHMIAMNLCGLEVDSENLQTAYNEVEPIDELREAVMEELNRAKLVQFGSASLTLKDFLSETGAVASRRSMISPLQINVMAEYFQYDYREQFPILNTMLQLQYKKMIERLQLMNPASYCFQKLWCTKHGYPMPDVCCRKVIRCIPNNDLRMLMNIASEDEPQLYTK